MMKCIRAKVRRDGKIDLCDEIILMILRNLISELIHSTMHIWGSSWNDSLQILLIFKRHLCVSGQVF